MKGPIHSDDTRDAIDMSMPRHRVDCATRAIMGMGMGSAGFAAVSTGKSVVAIEGDSAFGFLRHGILHYLRRFKPPVTVVIFNNGGIYNGVGENLGKDGDPAPPRSTSTPVTISSEMLSEPTPIM